MDPTFPLVPIVNFLFAILVLLLLPYRFSEWSTAIRVHIIWLALTCTCRGINSTIWKDHTEDIASVWCDISTRIFLGSSVAIPACSFSTVYRLYRTTCRCKLAMSRAEKRWEVIADLSLCLGFPLMVITLAYVVQGNRYDIYEEVGCVPYLYNTALLYVLVNMWPLLFGIMSAIYAGLVIRKFVAHHKELNEVLTNESSKITYSRFYRAFTLTSTDTMFTIPLAIFVIYCNAVTFGPVVPWPGWSKVHRNFSRVDTFPSALWRDAKSYHLVSVGVGWLKYLIAWHQWVYVFCTFTFVIIFGTSREVVQYYANLLRRMAKFLGWKHRGSREDSQTQDANGPARHWQSTIVFQSAPATRAVTMLQSSSVARGSSSELYSRGPGRRSLDEDGKHSLIEVTTADIESIYTSSEHADEYGIAVPAGIARV